MISASLNPTILPTQRIHSPLNFLAALILVFLTSFRFLSIEWSVNPQYSYGWGVPVLAAYLFWKRWLYRPEPDSRGNFSLFTGALCLLSLATLPLRLLLESNPDWRILLWTSTLVSVVSALIFLWFLGGKNWVKHFFIPITLVLFAVPWPTRLEQDLILGLTRTISAATVEWLNWLGIPASLQGNLIRLANGVVGVNEACSGVRSFQTTLMISVFCGELYQLIFSRRLALIFIGLIWTICMNLFRTATLTWIAATHGL